ncbi:leukocyte cell-derived chemotaxin-2-like, partial [Plectropomus leopardus]|uniref:leukocyte cell-derived chemotaxin-2-like n=1 Tax=Plectropomus leopardus TaxID=160734 RepID=UPI001C4D73B6
CAVPVTSSARYAAAIPSTGSEEGTDTEVEHSVPVEGAKTHKGLDIECPDGSKVYAPMDMTITRQSRPYGTNSAIDNGIAFTANDLPGVSFKLWYMHPVKTSGTVRKGEQIGTMLPMQSVYPGITSHVHLEKGDETDPQSIIGTQNAQANRLFCSHRD